MNKNKVLFVRVGWSNYYDGSKSDELIGGGEFNKENVGAEVTNFRNIKNYFYGHFANCAPSLDKIDPNSNNETLENVSIIYFAKHPSNKGQYVVGWYNDATVYKEEQYLSRYRRYYYVRAKSNKSVLVPTEFRDCSIPRGKNCPGQHNYFYLYDNHLNKKKLNWVNRIFKYIENYSDKSIPTRDISNKTNSRKKEVSGKGSQGFQEYLIRKILEDYSMNLAKQYYIDKGYSVADHSSSKPYDLYCRKGREEFFVEVKSSTTSLGEIILTKNEVKFHIDNPGKITLFLVHSIKLNKTNEVIYSKEEVIKGWNLDKKKLKPISYYCPV